MSVYTKLLASGATSSGTLAVIYTVPVDKVVVVTDVVLAQFSGGAAAPYITTDGPGGTHPILAGAAALLSGDVYHWTGRQVLAAGGVLELSANVAVVRYRVTGYLFDAA